MKKVTQEHPMGCAVACVASICGISYERALLLFCNKLFASTKGYYCKDICSALKRKGKNYAYKKAKQKINYCEGVIVFILRSKKYPKGHYLVKTCNGWMNPWINFPHINPAKAGFQKRLPGKADWIICQKN